MLSSGLIDVNVHTFVSSAKEGRIHEILEISGEI